ncbi:MAG: hypothetical protein RL660_2322 [Bacteroidota bacterium]|jgi:hypothetical protein
MGKLKILLVLTFISAQACAQQLDSIQARFAERVCNCIGEIAEYEDLKPKIDRCYKDTFNFIFNNSTPEEVKFYLGEGNLQKIGMKLEYYLKSQCPSVRKVIQEYIKPKKSEGSYPTNLDEKKLEAKRKDIDDLEGKIVAFDAEIVKVNRSNPERIFLEVKLQNGEKLWVGDMTNSELNIEGNKRRFLGYFVTTEKDDQEQTEMGYYIISFASYEKITDNLVMYPGTEKQIYEWANGKVPKSKK